MIRSIMGRTSASLGFCLMTLFLSLAPNAFPQQTPVYEGEPLKQLMLRVMDFQVKAYGTTNSINWQAAPFWVGVLAAHRSTGDAAFLQAAKKWGDGTQW